MDLCDKKESEAVIEHGSVRVRVECILSNTADTLEFEVLLEVALTEATFSDRPRYKV